MIVLGCFFFFQAEDGIRDLYVTGVQTCALPIWRSRRAEARARAFLGICGQRELGDHEQPAARVGQRQIHASGLVDRKSTRLNSSHVEISYAVFCLKKKKINTRTKVLITNTLQYT